MGLLNIKEEKYSLRSRIIKGGIIERVYSWKVSVNETCGRSVTKHFGNYCGHRASQPEKIHEEMFKEDPKIKSITIKVIRDI